MKQYIDACKRILEEGTDIYNERTGVTCRTLINLDFTYDVGAGQFPVATTRKAHYKPAIAELLGYLRGYKNAAHFREIGCNTWNANANENKAWLNNPNRKGTDDMGRVYGVQGRAWRTAVTDPTSDKLKIVNVKYTDQLKSIVNNLTAGIDDRGEILTFWNPGEFDLGCLRPCMHTHQFSLIDGTLHLNSFQRSCDMPLGYRFNAIQCYVLLALMAQITGHKPGKVYHKIVNAHIYENQIELMKEEVTRTPFDGHVLLINSEIKTLSDLETWVSTKDFELLGYEHHPVINYPFTV